MDELALGRSTDGGVAGLPGDPIEVEGEQGGIQAQPRAGDRRFTTGMAAADHDHVEGFGGGGGEAHGFIIRRHRRMEWSGEKFGLDSKHSVQIGVVENDFGVVTAVSEDEIAVELGCFKREFIFAN